MLTDEVAVTARCAVFHKWWRSCLQCVQQAAAAGAEMSANGEDATLSHAPSCTPPFGSTPRLPGDCHYVIKYMLPGSQWENQSVCCTKCLLQLTSETTPPATHFRHHESSPVGVSARLLQRLPPCTMIGRRRLSVATEEYLYDGSGPSQVGRTDRPVLETIASWCWRTAGASEAVFAPALATAGGSTGFRSLLVQEQGHAGAGSSDGAMAAPAALSLECVSWLTGCSNALAALYLATTRSNHCWIGS